MYNFMNTLHIKYGLTGRRSISLIACLSVLSIHGTSVAGLLDDNEARKAILDLRKEVRQNESNQTDKFNQLAMQLNQNLASIIEKNKQFQEEIDTFKRTILEINNTLIQSKEANARLSGQVELLLNQQQGYAADLNKQAVLLQTQQNQSTQLIEKIANLDKRVKPFDDELNKESNIELKSNTIDTHRNDKTVNDKTVLDTALNAFKKGNYLEANRILTAFVSEYPQSAVLNQAYFWLGNARYAEEDFKGAIAALNTLLKQYPNDTKISDALLTIAQSHEAMGDHKRSIAVYQSIIAKFPNTAAAKMAAQSLPEAFKRNIKK